VKMDDETRVPGSETVPNLHRSFHETLNPRASLEPLAVGGRIALGRPYS
jgi:hypothetical protein